MVAIAVKKPVFMSTEYRAELLLYQSVAYSLLPLRSNATPIMEVLPTRSKIFVAAPVARSMRYNVEGSPWEGKRSHVTPYRFPWRSNAKSMKYCGAPVEPTRVNAPVPTSTV
jgi:hypothetical protein